MKRAKPKPNAHHDWHVVAWWRARRRAKDTLRARWLDQTLADPPNPSGGQKIGGNMIPHNADSAVGKQKGKTCTRK